MPSSFRFVPNPAMYGELARNDGIKALLADRAGHGAEVARAIAPKYSGPTYQAGVARHDEYVASIYSAASLAPSGWRAEFGADAPWALQVEFGSGRPATRRVRPQSGDSPKTRTLGRALDALRGA